MALAASERSLGELLRELSHETSQLFRKEVELAQAEMSQKAARVGGNVGRIALGGGVALAGGLALLYAAISALTALFAQFMPLGVAVWLAPLLVGGALLFFGYSRIKGALGELKDESLVPTRTTKTLQENKEWLKARIQ
jgi:hypothetical protein